MPKQGSPGRKPTVATLRKISEGSYIEESNEQLIEQIHVVKQDPDLDYGYQKMTVHLMLLGYFINSKKTYRLMKENQLLRTRRKFAPKPYVKYRTVTPERPLEVLEMDIKQVWVTKDRRHAYILSIIDTFTRAVLHWNLGFTLRQSHIKDAWEQVIEQYLQPADLLNRKIHVELRNDNDSRFSGIDIRSFFEQNYIGQVFNHPYTPQENGHVESFHKIMVEALNHQVFWSLDELERRLIRFYDKYNNERIHSSIANLWPIKFWELWEGGHIEIIGKKKNQRIFKLNMPYQNISGNENLREVSCSNPKPLNEVEDLQYIEVVGPESLQTTSV